MPVFVGPNSPSPGTDFEGKSDRVGLPVRSSNPSPASAGDMYFNSTDDEARVYDGTDWVALGGPAATPFTASGGTTNTYTLNSVAYKSHTFTSPGTFTVTAGSKACDILVVAGGGGGGYSHGGGGGAGGYRTVTQTLTGPLSISVTVGNGGAVGTSPSRKGTNGGNSVFASPSPITSTGGGGGSSYPSGGTGNPGGSGGGGGGHNLSYGDGNTPPTSPPQGNPGGHGSNGVGHGGGGGGAGAAGTAASGTSPGSGTAGPGGAGLANNYRTGSNVTYAGGGGGGSWGNVPSPSHAGGSGGGGAGANEDQHGIDGTANTGGGGGGGGAGNPPADGGDGGSGIVVVRYQT